jgi:uncharacterized membrane protein YjfL (UPF0719 family)
VLLPFAQIERPLTLAVDNAPTRLSQLGGQLLAVIIFSLVGVVVFVGCLYLIERLTPFSIHREIIDEHNTSVGIVVGSIIIGMSMIIASAVMG